MKAVEISQSEKDLKAAYEELLDRIIQHVQVLAMYDEPIDGAMQAKRGLYQVKELLEIEKARKDIHRKALTNLKNKRRRISQRILWLVEEIQQKLGVDVLEMVKMGMVAEKDLQRVLIQFEYVEMAKAGYKYKDIKQFLSYRHDWSVSRIEKLVYREKALGI